MKRVEDCNSTMFDYPPPVMARRRQGHAEAARVAAEAIPSRIS
jgi:hypothetical protein